MAVAAMVLARLSICVLVVLCILCGIFAERDQPLIAGIFLGANVIPLAVLFKSGGLEIGRPQMLPKQVCCEAMVSVGVMLIPGALFGLQYQLGMSTGPRSLFTFIFCIVGALLIANFGSTGVYITMSICSWILGYSHLLVHDPGTVPKFIQFAATFPALSFIMCCFLIYKRDQCTIFMAAPIGGVSVAVGGYLETSTGKSASYLLLVLIFVYFIFLWLRRRRHLPEGLRGCKFVRLDYLRHLAAQGGPIRRYQELPPEAFGDVTKAQYLLIVSHRWIHRYICDIATGEFPEGVRLQTMLQKLDLYFSTKALGKGRNLAERWRRFCSCLTGGRDILLFFDFMSLPQVGMASDGSLLLRSEDDTALFKRCLPHMGTLYSMFPVLVCEEVVGDVLPYSSSGWCFSELSIGLLGKQLDAYSFNSGPVLELTRPKSLRGDGLTSFIDASNAQLATKNFFDEGDRDIVRGIINGFLYKSRLVDAINSKDQSDLSDVLCDLEKLKLHDFLDQPVDASLNTPLHLAVAKGFTVGVELLMQSGAKRTCVNWYGDTPVQRRLFPRLSKAAMACRFYRQSKGNTPSTSPSDTAKPTSHFVNNPEEAETFDDEDFFTI